MNEAEFDMTLARECATAFSYAAGLRCEVSDKDGRTLFEAGGKCGLCEALGRESAGCARAQSYGMSEAVRFGGKYIFFCPIGLTCFVSPIMGRLGGLARITAGPFLMVDRDDFAALDLEEKLALSGEPLQRAVSAIEEIPCLPAGRVNALSNLLFMAVGFMNNVSEANRMLDEQESGHIQGQITEYILQLKGGEKPPVYPMEIEDALLLSITQSDKPEAQRRLNELFGYIFLRSGGNFAQIKSRVCELLVLISRAAIRGGAGSEQTLLENHRCLQEMNSITSMDALCGWLTGVMHKYMDELFDFSDVKHSDIMHKTVRYVRENCVYRITLEDAANEVHLSPSYFSKIFKQEMGCNFTTYLNNSRIEKSRALLADPSIKLLDVAAACGFEDQSYFTKVFKRVTGVSPNKYRESGGKR